VLLIPSMLAMRLLPPPTALILPAVLGWLFGSAETVAPSGPPLPPKLEFAEPAPGVPPQVAAFLGVWRGTWSSRRGGVRTNNVGERLTAIYHVNSNGSISATFRDPYCADTEHHSPCLSAYMFRDGSASERAGTWLAEQALRAKGFRPLTQEELEKRYEQPVTARSQSDDGNEGKLTFTPDGSVGESGTVQDTGTWRIKEGRLCVKFMRFREGAERCFTHYKTDKTEFTLFMVENPVVVTLTDLE